MKALNFCLLEWQLYPGGLKQVEVGPFGVWGVNKDDNIFKKTSKSWDKVPGALKDISVGKNSVWGTSGRYNIYKRVGDGNWQHVEGKLRQVG